jgi:hypothetical protein
MIMFKSVFTKYLSAFTLILFVSFTILATVLYSAVNNYAQSEKSDSIIKVADTVLGFMYWHDGNGSDSLSVNSFSDYIKENHETLLGIIYALDEYTEDINTYITDAAGNVLLQNESFSAYAESEYSLEKLPSDIIELVKKNGSYSGTGTLTGANSAKHLIYALPISFFHISSPTESKYSSGEISESLA